MANSAMVIVDVQHDFADFNAPLAVPNGFEVVTGIVDILNLRSAPNVIYATRDWHPYDHISFESEGGPWPEHCVAGTPGAEIVRDVDRYVQIVFSKGMDRDKEAYSGFDGTVLGHTLRQKIREFDPLLIVGLATDYCVKATALDAVQKYGFTNVIVPLSATKGVAIDTTLAALEEMREAGVKIA